MEILILSQFFFEKLVCDLEIVENCVFDVMVKGTKRKVEFKVPELPNDIKMPSYLAGELSNATTYILTFPNVRYKDCPYSRRISGAEKAMQKKESLDKTNLAKLTKHNQLTYYISNQLKSRQMKFPLIGKFVDCPKAELLHLKNNTVKEHFMHLFKICVSQSNLQQFKSFKEIPKDCLFDKFVNFIKISTFL